MRVAILTATAVVLFATAARAQPSPQPGPPQQVLEKNLFGEREPGDEEEPDAPQNPAAPEATPPTKANPSSAAYDARIRQSFAAAQAYSGPLEGGWTLAAKDEGKIFDLRFVDRSGKLEGVWRDLRRPGALGASGLVDEVERTGGKLTFRFSPMAGVTDVAVLAAGPANTWTGELEENGRKRAVSLAKTSP